MAPTAGRRGRLDGDALAEEETFQSMIRVGWAKDDPLFRRVFTRIFIPAASEEQMRWFDDLQRMSTSPANAVASRLGRLDDGRGRRAAVDRHADPDPARDRRSDHELQRGGRGRGADPRMRGLSSWTAPITSSSRESRRGRRSSTRSAAFLEPDRGPVDPHRPPMIEAPSPRELDVIRLAARGSHERRDRRRPRIEPANGRTPSVEPLREDGCRPARRRVPRRSRRRCGAVSPDLRAGRHH